jgi:protein transport protein SEC24
MCTEAHSSWLNTRLDTHKLIILSSPSIMHSRDFLTQAMHSPSKQFPKAYENQRKPRMSIPDFPTEIEKDQQTFFSFDTAVQPPPLSTTNCLITETTNTDPNLLRATMYTIPTSVGVFDSMNMPFALVLTPFSYKASPAEADSELAVRCLQCQSFVNIFTKTDSEFFYCNICNRKNPRSKSFSDEIFKHSSIEYVSRKPRRADTTGEVPNLVSQGHFKHQIVPGAIFVFGLDLTVPLLLSQAIQSLEKTIHDEGFKFLYRKIAVLTFTDAMTILRPAEDAVSEIFLADTSALPFISPEFLFDLQDGKVMVALTEYLRDLKPSLSSRPPSLADVLTISASLSKFCCGGKTALFTNSQDKLDAQTFCRMLIDSKNSLSIFSLQKSEVAKVCYGTAGQHFSYSPEKINALDADLLGLCTAKSVFGVHVEAKVSDALHKAAFYGNTIFEHLTFQEFAQMDNNTTFGISFYVEESLRHQEKVYAQVILDYYAVDGSSRTLVLNTSFTASDRIQDVYNGISFDTLACAYVKFVASDEEGIKENTTKVERMICRGLKYYRNACCRDASNTQFVLPDSYKLMPLVFQAMLKNNSLSNRVNYNELRKIMNFTVEQNLRYFYPRLFSFTDFYMDQSLERTKSLRLSAESLSPDEIYVLENSQKIYLYIGRDVDESLKDALFTQGAEESNVLYKMVGEICTYYGYELPVVVVEERCGGAEIEFIGYLVEDRLNNIPAYSDYICELHFKVKNA